jgi:hypothetical protein
MACAYVFAIIALVALPQAIHDSFAAGFAPLPLVTWLSQSFLQLVLLSVIMKGQDIQGRAVAKRATEQYDAVMETLKDIRLLVAQEDKVAIEEEVELADIRRIEDRLTKIEALLTR